MKRYLVLTTVAGVLVLGVCAAVLLLVPAETQSQKVRQPFGPWDGSSVVTGKLGDNQFGERAWVIPLFLEGPVNARTSIAGDYIIFAVSEDDFRTGKKLLAVKAANMDTGDIAWSHFPCVGLIGARDDRIFVFKDKAVAALDLKTGKEVWSQPGEGNAQLTSQGLLVVSYEGDAQVREYKKGAAVWKDAIRYGAFSTPFWADDKIAYFINQTATLQAADLKTGKKLWEYTVASPREASVAACRDGQLYVNTGTALERVEGKTGKVLARSQKRPGYAGYIFAGESLYIVEDGYVTELAMSDLSLKRTIATPEGWTDNIIVTDDVIVLSAMLLIEDHEAFVFRRDTGRLIQRVPGGGHILMARDRLVVESWHTGHATNRRGELSVFPIEAGTSRYYEPPATPSKASFEGLLAGHGDLMRSMNHRGEKLGAVKLEESWNSKFGMKLSGLDSTIMPQPTLGVVVTKGVIAAIGDTPNGYICAHDVETGKELWKCDAEYIGDLCLLGADSERIYTKGRGPGRFDLSVNRVWAIDPATGWPVYCVDFEARDPRVFFDRGSMYVWGSARVPGATIDPKTGFVLATHTPDYEASDLLSIEEGIAYLTNQELNKLVAWRLSDAKALWSYTLPGRFSGYPMGKEIHVEGERLYVYDTKSTMALDAKTGKVLWKAELNELALETRMNLRAVTSTHLLWYVDKAVHAFSLKDGKRDEAVSNRFAQAVTSDKWVSITTFEDAVMITTDKELAITTLDGTRVQHFEHNGYAQVGCGSVFAIGGDGTVRRLVPK